MSVISIRANISRSHLPDFRPTRPPGYFYLFSGGYPWENDAVGSHPVAITEGPAGLVRLGPPDEAWAFEVNDTTGEGFRIVSWHLVSEPGLGAGDFHPRPDTELAPREALRVDLSGLSTDHQALFRGYGLSLENRAGTRLRLDPRFYDLGPD